MFTEQDPFDPLTQLPATSLNQMLDNIQALHEGTGLADGSITNDKLSTDAGELGGAWQTWTPTVTGFSSVPTNSSYRYKRIGKSVTLSINQGTNGTSNATTFTISLPIQAATVTNHTWGAAISQLVNGGSVPGSPGLAQIDSGATVLGLFSTSAGASWTSSGGKRIIGLVITYEIA